MVISSQPLIGYQNSVTHSLLSPTPARFQSSLFQSYGGQVEQGAASRLSAEALAKAGRNQNLSTHADGARSRRTGFTIESVGPEASTEISTDEYLDTLARWLYQEGILRKIIN